MTMQLSFNILLIGIILVIIGLIAIYQNVTGYIPTSFLFIGTLVAITAIYVKLDEIKDDQRHAS